MARYFDITAVTTSIELGADRTGQAAFTVTNSSGSSIGGDAIVVAQDGAEKAKYVVDKPNRHYDPGVTQNVTVTVTAPATMPPGTYGFQLRVLLSGGVPEEQYDDSPAVSYKVEDAKIPQGDAKVPAKRNIPWIPIAIVGVIAAVVIIGAIVFVATRPKPTATITVFTQVTNDNGFTAAPGDFAQSVTAGGVTQPFNGSAGGVPLTVVAGQYVVRQNPQLNYSTTFSAGCAGELAANETRSCTVFNDDFFIIFPPIIFTPLEPIQPVNQ